MNWDAESRGPTRENKQAEQESYTVVTFVAGQFLHATLRASARMDYLRASVLK
jgi:hypothetical protein